MREGRRGDARRRVGDGPSDVMASLALSAEQRIEAPPDTVFELFGAGAGAGWLFDAMCDRWPRGPR